MIGYNKDTQSKIGPDGRTQRYKTPPTDKHIRKHFDYIRAKIRGFGGWEEVVFMEKAYSRLRLERLKEL